MANPIKGEVPFDVGGRTFTLCLGINAIAELEAVVDAGVVEIANWFNDRSKLRAGNMRAVLWAALRKHHPDIDLLAAGDLIQEAGLQVVVVKLGEAIQAAFPEAEPENPQTQEPGGTGTSS